MKSFFTPAYSRKWSLTFIKSSRLIWYSGPSSVRPLELWRGFFQSVFNFISGRGKLIHNASRSVRPTFDRVIVNVDVTVGVVWVLFAHSSYLYHLLQHFNSVPAKPLEMICGDYVSVRNTRELSALKQSQFQQLRLFVRGLKVVVDLPGHRGKRPKTIKDLVQNVGAVVFDKGGVPTSIAVCCFCSAMTWTKYLLRTIFKQCTISVSLRKV